MNAIPVFMHPTLKYLTLLMTVLFNPHAPNPTTVAPLPFSGTHWREVSLYSHAGQYTTRQRMVTNVQQELLPGKSAFEVRDLLGRDESSYMGSSNSLQDGDIAYYLGKAETVEGGFTNQWLVLSFDENENCNNTIIVTEGRF